MKLPRHRHICGDIGHRTAFPMIDLSLGCGHVWEHAARGKPHTAAYIKRHMCPKCGRGPWKIQIPL